MINIKEIAKKANVGVGTVSRVINNSGYVSQKTREKVERVIAETGYHSNEIARSMSTQHNNIVAFLLPNSTHYFFGSLIHEVEQELYKNGYHLMLCQSSEQLEKEIIYIDLLKKRRVDGIILLSNNDIESYLDETMPIVTFDRKFDFLPFVASNNYQGGVLAAQRLIKQGCKHFAFVGDDAQGEHSSVQTDVSNRRLGFIDELKRQGVESMLNVEYPLGDYNYVPDYVYDTILERTELDGIFCNNDNIAAEVVMHLESKNRLVPNNVKVIGFDGGAYGFNLGRSITSIVQDTHELSIALVASLIDLIKYKKTSNKIVPVTLSDGETG